nr:MAG TPA: hypothetical protein [Caudoviricetes sp.]
MTDIVHSCPSVFLNCHYLPQTFLWQKDKVILAHLWLFFKHLSLFKSLQILIFAYLSVLNSSSFCQSVADDSP